MKTSLAWLNSYLDRPTDADEAERLLTDLGFPFDGVEPAGGDVCMDVEVTSNRGDCLSHVGLARELAAASTRQLIEPDCDLPGEADQPAENFATVRVDDAELCPLYTARIIRGVKVGPSPRWLVDYLDAVGLRSVNNVVDVTNFVLLETGQPLHAFDLALLEGAKIIVRRARRGELFTAIDGSKHELADDMLVIADGRRAVAMAGVMGGLDSEVSAKTTDVLLESAMFAPLSVRHTSRSLKLSSDSSYRFERGVDPNGVERASRRAAKLICELAGGALAKGVIRVGVEPPQPKMVSMRVQRCNELLGREIHASIMVELLRPLGLQPVRSDDGHEIHCAVPTFRLDLQREVDLIEEVARLHGFDEIDVQQKIHIVARRMQPSLAARQKMDEVLSAHGMYETITFSFVSPRQGEAFLRDGEKPLMIDDDRRKAEPMLRPSLLPSLLACRKTNQDVGNEQVRLYERAATWVRGQSGAIVERDRLGMLLDVEGSADDALRDLRGIVEELVSNLAGGVAVTSTPVRSPLHSAAAEVAIDGVHAGVVGVLSPKVTGLFDLQTPVVAAELEYPVLLSGYPPAPRVSALPRFPGIERDLSVVVSEDVPWARIEQAVRDTKPALLEALRFIGVYRGKPIAKGLKSVSFRMLFRDPQTTLRHEQVDPQVAAVVARLKKDVNAELRA